MKMRTLFVMAAATFALTACKDDCEKASDRLADRYEECGISTSDGSDGDGSDAECTDEAAALFECYADCADAAECDVVDGSSDDTDALIAYGECFTDCAS